MENPTFDKVDYRLRLLVEAMVVEGRDTKSIEAAVRTADDRPRVLVVEDETIVRMELADALAHAGFVVCGQAADGPEAVELALHDAPDAIVMDAGLPGLDGVTAAETILASRNVPIVMLSGYRYGELIERAFAAGVSRYLVKPVGERELVAALRAVVAR